MRGADYIHTEVFMSYRKNRLLSIITALTLAAGYAAAFPVTGAAADPEEQCTGVQDVVLLDDDGNVVEPDLIPDTVQAVSAAASDSYFNLYNYGRATGIRNQNPLGTCWAHAALASAESSMITKGYADSTIDYSEAHLAWFGNGAGPSDKNDPMYGDTGYYTTATDAYKNGAPYHNAMGALARWSGCELESTVPYSLARSYKKIGEEYRYDSYAHMQNAVILDKSDRTSIKNALVNNGALYMEYYHDDAYLNDGTAAYYSPVKSTINHAVTIVGWDDNFSLNKFSSDNRPTAKGAWICKNSWDTWFGDNGLFYVSYEESSLKNIISFDMEKTDNYDRLYQYDGAVGISLAEGGGLYYTGLKAKKNSTSANVFTAKGGENLASVGFYTYDAGVPYKITIFTGVKDTPTSGKAVLTQTGKMTYAGYHTVKLNKPVQLTAGQKFAVAVSFTGSDWAWHFYDNYNPSKGLSYYANTSSFTTSTSWTDTYTEYGANACIKAYTTAVGSEAPANVKASAGDGKVTLTWNKVEGASNYAVFLRKGTEWLKIGSTGTDTTFTSRGLANGGKYFYMVKAYVNGVWSDESATVFAIPQCITPQNVKAFPGDGKVTLTWDKVAGASNYAVFLRKGSEWLKIGSTGASTTFTSRGLPNGGKYFYMVKAYVNGSWSDESAVVSASPTCITPQNVEAAGGAGSAVISWSAVSGASNYTVFVKNGSEWKALGSAGTKTSYTAAGLAAGTYSFAVKAYVNGAWSDMSAQAQANVT